MKQDLHAIYAVLLIIWSDMTDKTQSSKKYS